MNNATIRIGANYGITDRLMVGVGRSEYKKTFDGFAKYRLLRQSGKIIMPISVSYVIATHLKAE